ncbi:hypothetical protein BMR1_03g00100 [Babesia microti strain RI]|uniref:Uncharacterized protein n=1 Tax=Babesia microti (strain RI) TaxID=1133968 RepID=A0A0K3AQA0_BABMR|nr:hypothetical protein BMR1_03g00100 [Babesia microti strain RI]CTQ40620.1 hypothetical protein BMR1_03g00100 [Babesia microti strain RI]|eukprot:XP_012648631.1 hypothetical protein BMR1_03g00100 [Babesia microti strain RI]
MSIKFNTLCSLIKKLQINTKNDIKRLERVVPSVINAIEEHPAHTSLLLYHLSKATSLYRIDYDCKTCKGLCKITFQVLSPHTFEALDRLSPKALAQILKIYSNCRNDTKITDQIQLRLCFFMLSCLKFPVKYFNTFNSWASEYRLSASDYLNLKNSALDQSKFYLPLVVHDVADLIQSLFQFLCHSKSNTTGVYKHQVCQFEFKTKLVLDVSLEYIGKLLQYDLTGKDIHGITRIFYYYNELHYFGDDVRELWMLCMDNFLNSMNMYDICTMLHAIRSPLDKYTRLIQLLEGRLSELLSVECYLKSISMILNALFKCNIRNSYIAHIAHSQITKLLNCSTKVVELMQVIKMLKLFDVNVSHMISLLHKQTSNCGNLFQLFDVHDLTIILKWYNLNSLDSEHIVEAVLSVNNLKDFAGVSKFDNLYHFAVQLYESSLLNDRLVDVLSKSLESTYVNCVRGVRFDKLVRLYEIFQVKLPCGSNHWIEDVIFEIIKTGSLIEILKTPLDQYPKFVNALKRRIETDSSISNDVGLNLIIKLCNNGALHNLSLLPIDCIIKQCNVEQLSCLLKYIPKKVLPILDIKSAINNTKHGPSNKNLALCIYKCILNGIRDEYAGLLIDYFIDCRFDGFKELMMICIIANLPNITQLHSVKIVEYFLSRYNSAQLLDHQKLKILNKLISISLRHQYYLADKLVAAGIELINGMEPSNEMAVFVSYVIRLDKYRNAVICNAVHTLLADYNIHGRNHCVLATMGFVGMQYWGNECIIKWLKLANSVVDNDSDFYTSIQLRLFVNTTLITLLELKLMDAIVNKAKTIEFGVSDNPIIREVEEAINYSTTRITMRPKVDILILSE